MFYQQTGCLHFILCITLSLTYLFNGGDALQQKMSKEHLSTFKMFDRDFKNNRTLRDGLFLKQKENERRKIDKSHKKLAEDVLRIYMTAYFIANKARKCFSF